MADIPILERLPPLVQNERSRDQLSVLYDTTEDVYSLPKAPVLDVYEVTGTSDESPTTFTEGVDYTLVSNSDGNYEEIDWSIGGISPDDDTEFVVDQSFRTIIERYTTAHDSELETFGGQVDETITSHEVDNASEDELERIGELFGTLGQRRGRDIDDYRLYLSSIARSFNGRGSLQGLRFAIASAIGTDEENIRVVEDFEELEYSIQIFDVDAAFISSPINDLAELADPSVVQLTEAIILIDGGGVLAGGGDSIVLTEEEGLGGGVLTMDGNSQLG